MLRLSFDMQLGPGGTALPEHVGGALKGFIESATRAHAPHLLGLLRPGGENHFANFAVHAPPVGATFEEPLRCGLMLFGEATEEWPVLVDALIKQTAKRFNGRVALIEFASMQQPGSEPIPVIRSGQLIDPKPQQPESQWAWLSSVAAVGDSGVGEQMLHVLTFRSPLHVASHDQARVHLPQSNPLTKPQWQLLREGRVVTMKAGSLPWPTLGQLLDSLADRMNALEPELARASGVRPGWRASKTTHLVAPLTPAADPARQIVWLYKPKVPAPGILGTLIYRASGDPVERQLLHWGQWLGIGQRTTMGCGSFVLSFG